MHAGAQSAWKQGLQYNIHATFRPAEKSIDAIMALQYVNRSPDTLRFIWFHVWPNAYRNDRTSYSEQQLENGSTAFYFSSKEQKGYLNRLEFRVGGIQAKQEDHPEYIDVVKLILPKPLLPGDSVSISSSFHVRLPYNFDGNGYNKHHFEFKNWYPEPAVYDKYGWHPMPFLVQGGAYHETADYNVEIETPAPYCIAAGSQAETGPSENQVTIYKFMLKNANSFAWVADDRFKIKRDSLQLATGKKINIEYFYVTGNIDSEELFSLLKTDLNHLSETLISYPGNYLSMVASSTLHDQNFTGMVNTDLNNAGWRSMLGRSLAGQWFRTILMTDERNIPWFSKGFIKYYDQQLSPGNAGWKQHADPSSLQQPPPENSLWLRVAEEEKSTQPISTSSPAFSSENDSLIAGDKAARWLVLLQDSVGTGLFNQHMQQYFLKWRFNHPYPEDFKFIMQNDSGNHLQSLYADLQNKKKLFPDWHRTLKPAFVFSARETDHFNYISLSPVPGYNRYDGFMLGALIHNINLPGNHVEFLFTPMYAFGSKTIEGLGRMSYTWHPDARLSKISIGVNGARFDTNSATDSSGVPLYENFTKLVPYLRVDFLPTNPRSTIKRWMDFKTYLINENRYGNFNVSGKDSLIHPNSTSDNFRYLNQLSFNLTDRRKLYPYDLRVELQQAEFFYRINLHADYFLNYADGGGMQVRLFASKFGVWNSRTTANVIRYEPKLLGVTGDEDYLYEDYFIGRSSTYAVENASGPNGGLPAQQIMNRDGGLKLRQDAYDALQGRSADWVSALNFSTTLPANLFPLPVRIFFDVGTYAEAWQNNAQTSRFLYTGGIQLSLFKNVLNIYAPLIYSSDFSDALNSTSFGQKITFSIDIQNINYKKIIRRVAQHE